MFKGLNLLNLSNEYIFNIIVIYVNNIIMMATCFWFLFSFSLFQGVSFYLESLNSLNFERNQIEKVFYFFIFKSEQFQSAYNLKILLAKLFLL